MSSSEDMGSSRSRRSKILAGAEHNHLSNRKCQDLKRKFMGRARSLRLSRNKIESKAVQGIRQEVVHVLKRISKN